MNKQINKICKACKADIPLEAFYKASTGYSSKCKACTIAYNTEYRRNRISRPKPRRVPLYELHRKLISGRGPETAMFSGRYIHTRKEFALYRGPWGLVLDGELMYGEYSDDDVLHILHTRHMKLTRRCDVEFVLEDVICKTLLVKNSCGVPISVRFVKGLVSRCQYFLWMDEPRKLLLSEAAHQTQLSEEIINFLLPEKGEGNQKSPLPGNIKNHQQDMPQVSNITYEYSEE